ncbi:MAG: asparaginase [Aridibacter sp.]
MKSEILVKVTRGGTLESVHRGTLIVVDGDGKKVAEIGDASEVTYWRSAAKALQAIPLITSGAADTFGFTEKEIALACGSHSGESFHTETVRQMLEKTGFSEKDLCCGSQPPFDKGTAKAMIKSDEKPTQLHNNCSGKHTGMLALAKHTGANHETYLDMENPVQKMILETVSIFTEIPYDEIKLGIDGCSAPNFAVPLDSMALAFAKLINPPPGFDEELKNACERIVSAKMKYPEMVGGSDRLDTKVMQTLEGKIICKVGAEGVWSAGILPCEKWEKGLGIALKIEDGDDNRARPVVAVELLRQLGVMTYEAEETLKELSPMILKNRMDIEVGEVVADFEI